MDRYGSEARRYRPDFIVLVDDGNGSDDPLHLIVEIKGYRREDAKEKDAAMETYWVPGVNHLGRYGRWAFAEFRDVYEIESGFEAKKADYEYLYVKPYVRQEDGPRRWAVHRREPFAASRPGGGRER